MSTTHDRQTPITVSYRPGTRSSARCLRHSVWMAACGDCRDAHREELALPAAGSQPRRARMGA